MESRKELFDQIFIKPIDIHDDLLNQGSYMKSFEEHLYNSLMFAKLTNDETIILLDKIKKSDSTKHNKDLVKLIVKKGIDDNNIIKILKYYKNEDYKYFIKLLANVVEVCSSLSKRPFFNNEKRNNDFKIITLRLIGKYIVELND